MDLSELLQFGIFLVGFYSVTRDNHKPPPAPPVIIVTPAPPALSKPTETKETETTEQPQS